MSNEEQQSPPVKPSGLTAFWAELRRRKVMRVAVAYAVVAWLVIQVAVATFPYLLIPDWALRLVIMLVILGFPVSLIIAWAFELTPEGIKTTKVAREKHSEESVSGKHLQKRNWFWLLFGAAIPTLLFGTLALFFYIQSGGVDSDSYVEKSIAILPLENLSTDQGHAYFADAIHDEILTNLANVGDLFVIGRTSVRQYKDTVKTIRQIGEELGVRYLVEGSVFRDENQASINIQLIDARTGGHIWAEIYDRNLDNLFSIRSAVAKDVAEQLHAVLSPEEVAQIEEFPTKNREAYDYYLKAGLVPSSIEKISLLEMATNLDPEFLDAWHGLAINKLVHWRFRYHRSDPDLLAMAYKALNHVERLAPDTGRTFEIKADFAFQVEDDLEKALLFDLRAKSLGIRESNVGLRYLQMGRLELASREYEEIFRFNPLSAELTYQLFWVYNCLSKWNEARELLQGFVERSEDQYHIARNTEYLALIDYLEAGNREKYIAARTRIPGRMDFWREELWEPVASRNHRRAIELTRDQDFFWFQLIAEGTFYYRTGLGFRPLELLAALLWFDLGEKEAWLKETEKAKGFFEDFQASESENAPPDTLSLLSICYALEGDRQKVESLVPRIREIANSVNWQFTEWAYCEMHIAIAYIVLGDHDKAIETLEAASKMHTPIFLNRELDLWFIFDRLRGNPRFDALLEN